MLPDPAAQLSLVAREVDLRLALPLQLPAAEIRSENLVDSILWEPPLPYQPELPVFPQGGPIGPPARLHLKNETGQILRGRGTAPGSPIPEESAPSGFGKRRQPPAGGSPGLRPMSPPFARSEWGGGLGSRKISVQRRNLGHEIGEKGNLLALPCESAFSGSYALGRQRDRVILGPWAS